MAKKEKSEPEKRKPLKTVHLVQYSMIHLKDVLAAYEGPQRIEIAEHLLQMFTDIGECHYTSNTALYDAYRQREEVLLKKYGKAFKPVISKSFYKLFNFQMVLSETDYYTSEEFNALEDQVNQLTPDEIQNWTQAIKSYLNGELRAMYLDQEPDFETAANEELSGTTDKEMTEARQLLAIYFILKAGFNIEPKISHSATSIAHLAHLLLGKPFTSAQNSNIYKKYKNMPEFNSGSVLVKDLRYIRHYFEELDMKNILELIDKQIASTLKEDK